MGDIAYFFSYGVALPIQDGFRNIGYIGIGYGIIVLQPEGGQFRAKMAPSDSNNIWREFIRRRTNHVGIGNSLE